MNLLLQISLPALPETVHVFWIVVWVVLVLALFAALVALTVSRWGRSQPLRIFFVLSLLAHVLLAGYAATIRIVAARAGSEPSSIEITIGDDALDAVPNAKRPAPQPWERVANVPPPVAHQPLDRIAIPDLQPDTTVLQRRTAHQDDVAGAVSQASVGVKREISFASARGPAAIDTPKPDKPTEAEPPSPAARSSERMVADNAANADPHQRAKPSRPPGTALTAIAANPPKAPGPTTSDTGTPAPAADIPQDAAQAAGSQHTAAHNSSQQDAKRSSGNSSSAAPERSAQSRDIPEVYRLRVAGNRAAVARRLGGSRDSEEAVKAGLRWLASAQQPDGRWNANRWGGGRERMLAQQDRQGAGAQADTGISALAVLAFLGAGHTHLDAGPYQENVRRGLEYLAGIQQTDGNLAGAARVFAAMYCHGMATFAISEAYAMTGDQRLRPVVQRAVQYTLAAQHPTTGGWRYRPGDLGDTSQLGWQVMALKSAETAGIAIPQQTYVGIRRFLQRVSGGRYGGLASYRTGQQFTHTMTAEALVCRQFVGASPRSQAATEAANFVVQNLPGSARARGEKMNLYFWYYAALALHSRQDDNWRRWNSSMQAALIEAQNQHGPLAGSWPTDTVWGGYGGRVYTTAMATLCLEVYYRYQTSPQ